jgi:hypothetical protein
VEKMGGYNSLQIFRIFIVEFHRFECAGNTVPCVGGGETEKDGRKKIALKVSGFFSQRNLRIYALVVRLAKA